MARVYRGLVTLLSIINHRLWERPMGPQQQVIEFVSIVTSLHTQRVANVFDFAPIDTDSEGDRRA